MLRVILVVASLMLSGAVLSQPKSTGDWSRRDAFVDPEALNEKIVAQWKGGKWSKKGLSGSFRFLVTEFAQGREKLYLQWLLADGEIAYSMSVKELNVRPEYDLELPRCDNAEVCRNLRVKARHYYEETLREFHITLDGLGHYSFKI